GVAALLEVIVREDCPVPSGPQRLRVFHRLSSFVALTGPGQRETETVGGGDVVRLLGERGAERRKRLRIVLLLQMDLPDVDLRAAVSRVDLPDAFERLAGRVGPPLRACDQAQEVMGAGCAGPMARRFLRLARG